MGAFFVLDIPPSRHYHYGLASTHPLLYSHQSHQKLTYSSTSLHHDDFVPFLDLQGPLHVQNSYSSRLHQMKCHQRTNGFCHKTSEAPSSPPESGLVQVSPRLHHMGDQDCQ